MKYGFLGAGHLASAVVFGLIKAGVQPDDIFVNSPASARSLADKTGIHYAEEKQLIGDSDLIVLAFLPEQLKKIIQHLPADCFQNKLIISFLGSTSLNELQKSLPAAEIVRSLPNVNAEFDHSLTSIIFGSTISEKSKQLVKDFFNKIGSFVELPEKDFPAFSAIAGSGPAFVALFAQSLQKAAINQGIDPETALTISLKTLEGSTENLLSRQLLPNDLIKAVASPGGSTADGIVSFEKDDFANIVNRAILATINHGTK